jgi:predicted aconitase
VRLTEEEESMLAGEQGAACQWAIRHIAQVGAFFDAKDTVEISQVHIMADPESVGAEGIEFLDWLGGQDPCPRVRVPTITDPRGVDFEAYKRLGQSDAQAELERRLSGALERLGAMLTNTCINYQTILPPVFGEHIAFGDTGSVIYANSVLGARSNFEGGPSALAAALSGRTPRYGYHLDECRRATALFELQFEPVDLSEWGAAGAIVGRKMDSYWQVPAIAGVSSTPTSDALKHFGAALASYGSTPLFHMIGVTPEAPDIAAVFDGDLPPAAAITRADIAQFRSGFMPDDDQLDVVVFAGPQLSLMEVQALAGELDGRTVHDDVTLIATVPPTVREEADRMGYTATIEQAGGIVLTGVCFYQMYAREIAEAQGWKRLMSSSAKLINILGGYGYEPLLGTMERCVESAVKGRIVP